jgi:hypothetical protein
MKAQLRKRRMINRSHIPIQTIRAGIANRTTQNETQKTLPKQKTAQLSLDGLKRKLFVDKDLCSFFLHVIIDNIFSLRRLGAAAR